MAISLSRSLFRIDRGEKSGRLARPACCLFIKVKQKEDSLEQAAFPSRLRVASLSVLPTSRLGTLPHPVAHNGVDARFVAASSFGAHERFTNPISDPRSPSLPPSHSIRSIPFFVK